MPSKQPKRRDPAPKESPPPGIPIADRVKPFLERHSTLLAVIVVAIASVRIVGTYWVYSHTADEPAHIICGLEWLDRGTYTFEAQHPPLARIAAAIGPYLLGARVKGPGGDPTVPTGTEDDYRRRFWTMNDAAFAALFDGGRYDQTLAAARAGILPFFWLACLVVYLWAKRDFGAPVAVIAVLLFTMLPPVLAHAGLATTDMALTATLGAALLAGRVWMERPSPRAAAVFGLCGGLAILAKFSSLVFFPAAAAVTLAWRLLRPVPGGVAKAVRDRLPTLAVAAAVALLVVWAGYRFSFGKVYFANLRLPAPEFFLGLLEVQQHNARGHLSYLLGDWSATGFWNYYPVVLAVKTPVGFLALALAGIVAAIRTRRDAFRAQIPLAFVSGILAVALLSDINIGVRHVLPVYLGLSILAAFALWRALEDSPSRRWLAGAALAMTAWMAISSGLAHPDYLPYFNEIAGSHPENIVVDSDLDWGQDLKRLRTRLEQAGAKSLTATFLTGGPSLPQRMGLPPTRPNDPLAPYEGWNAVSLTIWKQLRFGLGANRPDIRVWPETEPPGEKIGKGMRLWYFPPASGGAPQLPAR